MTRATIMTIDKEMIRAFVQQDGTLSTMCPACFTSHVFAPEKRKRRGDVVQVQCPCGKKYTVVAEFRRAYRRAVSLPGTYLKTTPEQLQGEMVIINMAMTGVGFQTDEGHALQQGDDLLLHFALADENKTPMEIVARVAHVSADCLGCSFQELLPHQEEELASFLMLIP